jgi:Zn-dependent protease with chaperone function
MESVPSFRLTVDPACVFASVFFKHRVIAVHPDVLLLPASQQAAVVAHEVGHVVLGHGDPSPWRDVVALAGVTAFSMGAVFTSLPFLGLFIVIAFFSTWSAVDRYSQRAREFSADVFASDLLDSFGAAGARSMAGALSSAATMRVILPHPSPKLSASSAGRLSRFVAWRWDQLTSTHPSLHSRLVRLDGRADAATKTPSVGNRRHPH